MSTVYLFQIDGAQNNDAFFNLVRPCASYFYKGIVFRVGDAPWIPDGVRVDMQKSRCLITLIELEDTRANALISARKYLPENSSLILRSLTEYLDRVISSCESTGDSRETGFASLKEILAQGGPIDLQTAGALRSSGEIVEQLPLIDQFHLIQAHSPQSDGTLREAVVPKDIENKPQPFQGVLRLDADRAKSLGRCVLILDAVIRGQDHSASTCHSWRTKAPLKRALRHANENPTLQDLVIRAGKTGLTLDFETLLAELVRVWASADFTLEDVRRMIHDYFPAASRVGGKDKMERVFEEARGCLKATKADILTASRLRAPATLTPQSASS
jgi:hypothetical protein